MRPPIWFAIAALSLWSWEVRPALPPGPVSAQPAITVPTWGPWRVGFRGVGPIRFGMTLKEASAALGESLTIAQGSEGGRACWSTVVPQSAPPGLSFMVGSDTIVRVDVTAPGVATEDGVEVGWSTARLERRYGDSLEATHSLGGEPEFILTSTEPERRYLIVFLTDGSRVVSYRAGRRIAAQLEECE